jgi:hypothetical protein
VDDQRSRQADQVIEDEAVNWDVQLDLALMGAQAILNAAPTPENIEEVCMLAGTWMALADSWSRRQDNEMMYQKMCREAEFEEAV